MQPIPSRECSFPWKALVEMDVLSCCLSISARSQSPAKWASDLEQTAPKFLPSSSDYTASQAKGCKMEHWCSPFQLHRV